MKVSIIIPAYNEEKTIGTVLKRVHALRLGNLEKEIIVVDDGSKDNTGNIAASFDKGTKIVKLAKNSGKGTAVRAGIEKCRGDIILIQDADLEYDTSDIPRLLVPVTGGSAEVVYGSRLRVRPVLSGKNKTPFLLHFFGNKFLSLTTTVLYGSRVSDMETGYKVFSRNALKGIQLTSKSFDFEAEITAKILKKGIKIREVDIRTKPRTYEEGKKINTVKDGFFALWTLLKYRFQE